MCVFVGYNHKYTRFMMGKLTVIGVVANISYVHFNLIFNINYRQFINIYIRTTMFFSLFLIVYTLQSK